MAVTLTVNGTPYSYPSPGDEPGWGEEATGWSEEVTVVLASLLGVDDILETTFTVNNNISSPTNITSLNFNSASARAAFIEYSIYRVSDSTTSGTAEAGEMRMIYDNDAGSGSKWGLSIGPSSGSGGVTFTVTDAGQFQYTSTDIGSVNYSGVMKFKASALAQ